MGFAYRKKILMLAGTALYGLCM